MAAPKPKPPKTVTRKVQYKAGTPKGPAEGGLKYRPAKPKVGGNVRKAS